MSHSHGPIPPQIALFDAYIRIAIPYCDTNKVRLKINALKIGALVTALGTWNLTIYPAYTNEATRSKDDTNNMNNLKETITDGLREIYGDLPESELLTTDRNTLNLPARDVVPTPAGVMDEGPTTTIESVKHVLHTLRFQNPKTPDSEEMPENQEIQLEIFVGEAGLTEDKITFGKSEKVTRFLYEVGFDPAQKGQTAYYRARYVNTRGQKSPPSDMMSEIVI
jgi:hypothetical protein